MDAPRPVNDAAHLTTHERQTLAIALARLYLDSADFQTQVDVAWLSQRLGVSALVLTAIKAYKTALATGSPTVVFPQGLD